MNTFSESVKEFGLFNFVSREMRRKRESYPAQQGHWVAPLPESRLKERPVAPRHELESFGKPRPIEPVKPLTNLGTADHVDEIDEELEVRLQVELNDDLVIAEGVIEGGAAQQTPVDDDGMPVEPEEAVPDGE